VDPFDPDTAELLALSAAGDRAAREALLDRHRRRLCQMVAVRMDPRLAARLDPSDVVQDALADAAGRLDAYLRNRPLPFYPWLRHLTWERIVHLHRRHVTAGRRSVRREEPLVLPDQSTLDLADRLLARGSSPSREAQRRELRAKVRAALDRLADGDREVLVLRHLEQLSVAETAEVLGVTDGAVKMRHLRALARLKELIGDPSGVVR
jgi:RNA polymerase sigma-70 factor, ECF subfamily